MSVFIHYKFIEIMKSQVRGYIKLILSNVLTKKGIIFSHSRRTFCYFARYRACNWSGLWDCNCSCSAFRYACPYVAKFNIE